MAAARDVNVTPIVLVQGTELPTTAAVYPGLFACPTDVLAAAMRALTAHNTSGSSRTVTVYLVPAGQAVAARYKWRKIVSLEADGTWDRDVVETLEPGDWVTAEATGAGVNLRVSGAKYEVAT